MDIMNHVSVLESALHARDEELLVYQINIDNYRLAVAKINTEHADEPDLIAFRDELQCRLDEERRQQSRAQIIRDVIAEQVNKLLLES